MFPAVRLCIILVQISFIRVDDISTSAVDGCMIAKNIYEVFHPFVSNAPFLYPLKTSENRTAFWYFWRVEKEWTGNKWVKEHVGWA